MRPEWNAAFFSFVTLYDNPQRNAIDALLSALFQDNDSCRFFERFGWAYEISFADHQAFAVYNDKTYPLIDATYMLPTPERPEYYRPLVAEGRLLLCWQADKTLLAYLVHDKRNKWQGVFLPCAQTLSKASRRFLPTNR